MIGTSGLFRERWFWAKIISSCFTQIPRACIHYKHIWSHASHAYVWFPKKPKAFTLTLLQSLLPSLLPSLFRSLCHTPRVFRAMNLISGCRLWIERFLFRFFRYHSVILKFWQQLRVILCEPNLASTWGLECRPMLGSSRPDLSLDLRLYCHSLYCNILFLILLHITSFDYYFWWLYINFVWSFFFDVAQLHLYQLLEEDLTTVNWQCWMCPASGFPTRNSVNPSANAGKK